MTHSRAEAASATRPIPDLYAKAKTRPAANDFNMHRQASKHSVQHMPDTEKRTTLKKIFCHKRKSQRCMDFTLKPVNKQKLQIHTAKQDKHQRAAAAEADLKCQVF